MTERREPLRRVPVAAFALWCPAAACAVGLALDELNVSVYRDRGEYLLTGWWVNGVMVPATFAGGALALVTGPALALYCLTKFGKASGLVKVSFLLMGFTGMLPWVLLVWFMVGFGNLQ